MAYNLHPHQILTLDAFSYCLVLLLGPTLLLTLLIFLPRKQRLHDAYVQSGVECIGIITHRRITYWTLSYIWACMMVFASRLLPAQVGRTTRIRYAYKAPGTETVYIKDYVVIKNADSHGRRRLLQVVVLPGQPESGVPKFLLPKKRSPGLLVKITAYLFSSGITLLCIYLFSLLYVLTFDCTDNTCAITRYGLARDVTLSITTTLSVGLLIAWFIYLWDRRSIPGRVWRDWTRSTTRSRALHERLTDREMTLEEAVAVLNADEATLANAATDAGLDMSYHSESVTDIEFV